MSAQDIDFILIRLRTLDRSCEELPLVLLLIDETDSVVGLARLSRVSPLECEAAGVVESGMGLWCWDL